MDSRNPNGQNTKSQQQPQAAESSSTTSSSQNNPKNRRNNRNKFKNSSVAVVGTGGTRVPNGRNGGSLSYHTTPDDPKVKYYPFAAAAGQQPKQHQEQQPLNKKSCDVPKINNSNVTRGVHQVVHSRSSSHGFRSYYNSYHNNTSMSRSHESSESSSASSPHGSPPATVCGMSEYASAATTTTKLSNTQLKKLKAREWRKKQKTGEAMMFDVPRDMSSSANGLSEAEKRELEAQRLRLLESSPLILKPKDGQASFRGITKCVAADCEMVGVGARGCKDMLARVSIVNSFGHVLYDKYVKPLEKVVDYRTFVSGIYPHHLNQLGVPFAIVQKEVCALLRGKILVGHAISHDLKVLYLDHPKSDIRDTSRYFRAVVYGGKGTPSLRRLTEHYLNINIQSSSTGHDSIEDARATMRLYTLFRDEWEDEIRRKSSGHHHHNSNHGGNHYHRHHSSADAAASVNHLHPNHPNAFPPLLSQKTPCDVA